MKLTDVVIAGKSCTKLVVPEGEALDEIALKVMRQDCPGFLLAVKTMVIDGELEIRYELSDGIRMSYSAMKLNKEEFIALLQSMLTPFRICNDWFLDYHNILLDLDYILVGKDGTSVKYAYIPLAGFSQSESDIGKFFEDVIFNIEITDDPNYTLTLLRDYRISGYNLMVLLDALSEASQKRAPQAAGSYDKKGNNVSRNVETARKQNTDQVNNNPQETGGKIKNTFNGARDTGIKATQKGTAQQMEESRPGTSLNKAGNSSRPGVDNGEFGKEDVAGGLIGNLFGDEDDQEEESSRSRKNKKEAKTEKPSKEKQQKGNGLRDLFKGKAKTPEQNAFVVKEDKKRTEARENEDWISMALANGGQTGGQIAGQTGGQIGGQTNRGRDQVKAVNNYEDDKTIIFDDYEATDNSILRLQLIDSGGYKCPKLIEIDLQKGYATVGRYDKNGNKQADFNFDASLSFVSRRHFRIETDNDQWRIIDLGSANGTYVNNEELTPNIPHPLTSGDRIMISMKQRLVYQVC